MFNKITNECPICKSLEQKQILSLKTDIVDASTLYEDIVIKLCNECGHIFNKLDEKQLDGLYKYYNTEYSLTNLNSPDKVSDRPGSLNKNTILRFNQLYELTQNLINENSNILDIGCAKGGFLEFLYSKGVKNLYGIDFSEDFISYSKNSRKYETKLGLANNIPFESNRFDMVYLDQVLEHTIKPDDVFKEVKRVLKKDGYFCIGVPNAMNYSKSYIFDFFWFLMKEHIHHFDIKHLSFLAKKNSFELINVKFNETPMMSGNVFLPNINAIFKYTNNYKDTIPLDKKFELYENLKEYFDFEFLRLDKKRKIINEIINKDKKLYFWGIGREFLFLLANTELKIENIYKLLDGNVYKRKELKIKNRSIDNPEILKNSNEKSVLIITAAAYGENIKKAALELNFKGEIIVI